MIVKTKKCKACGTEVVKLAKVCPECGIKLKMGWGKKLLIVFGFLIILGWIGSNGNSTNSVKPTVTKVNKTIEQINQANQEVVKISASDKDLLKKLYSTFDDKQRKQFAEIKEKYKNLPNVEVADVSVDFVRISNEEVIEVKKQAEAKAIADKQAAYQSWVQGQFSVWDGSNRYLVDLIKENLNDKKSFEHEKTTYVDKGDYLIVKMVYRAKNGFGGIILQNVTAKSDYKTNTISVISQND